MLRRLASALRRQDWTTVLIEFLVVVVGIFLGLQADSWYEDRQDRQLEREHLAQIERDLSENADELDYFADAHRETTDELMFAIGVLRRGELRDDERETFKWAILTRNQIPLVPLSTGGYDALLGSGNLALIRDPQLRSRLVVLHSHYDSMLGRADRIRNNTWSGILDESTYAISNPNGRGIVWRVDFERLRDDRGTLGVLAMMRRDHDILSDIYRALAAESLSLREAIAAHLTDS